MSTDAQINANRLNSQKSTGPTSPEGKARSSLNALKSGIDAISHIIPSEDPAELEALTAEFLLHFHPTDPNQLSLVDALISAEWTQRRLRRIEADLWIHHVECSDAGIRHDSTNRYAHQYVLDPFTRIQRRVDATNRLYLRTLKALQDLQSTPAKPVSDPTSPLPTQPLTTQIGFVPQAAPEPAKLPHLTHENPEPPLAVARLHIKSQILNPKSIAS